MGVKEDKMVYLENTFKTYEDAYVWIRGYILDKRITIHLAEINYEPKWHEGWEAAIRYETRKGA